MSAEQFYLFVLIVHVTASAVWVGGAVFSELILSPTFVAFKKVYQTNSLTTSSTKSFVKMVWISLPLMSVTGLAMLFSKGLLSAEFLLHEAAGLVMSVGIMLTVLAMINAGVITFVLMPRGSGWIPRAIRLNLALGISIVVLMALFPETAALLA